MYSDYVISREQESLERRVGIKLIRYDPDYSHAVEADLAAQRKKILDATPDLPTDKVIVALSTDRREFIRNERLLSFVDFNYWCRYARLLPDAAVGSGDLVTFEAWDSQQIILDAMKQIEESQYRKVERGEPCDGVLIAVPKARQEGISLLAAMVKMHRVMTCPYTLGVTATENADKRTKLWRRDVRIHEHLPWWLQPDRTAPDLQAEMLSFGGIDSSMAYQDFSQEGSLAAGEQYLVGHMSELAQGKQIFVEKMMTLDYFPAIPQSWRACHLLESTPVGMGGWWHPFIMDEYAGSGRWRVKFIPWYTNRFKYVRTPPGGWVPTMTSLEHANKVEATSSEYLGRVVRLTRDQLYWWEVTREEYRKKGNLAYFLTNYPATLEESFQTSATSIFDIETIEFYRTMTREPGGVYEVMER